MKQIADGAAQFFILAVVLLSAISIFGIWELMDGEVVFKSFLTIGLLAGVAIILMVADSFRNSGVVSEVNDQNNLVANGYHPIFSPIRQFTLSSLVGSVALLALFGILAIWEVLEGDVLMRSLASIAVIGFSSLVIVVTCLKRENSPLLKKNIVSGGTFVGGLFFLWILLSLVSYF